MALTLAQTQWVFFDNCTGTLSASHGATTITPTNLQGTWPSSLSSGQQFELTVGSGTGTAETVIVNGVSGSNYLLSTALVNDHTNAACAITLNAAAVTNFIQGPGASYSIFAQAPPYGADPTTTVDAAPAINAALAAAAASPWTNTVDLGPGSFLIESPIWMIYPGVYLRGAGSPAGNTNPTTLVMNSASFNTSTQVYGMIVCANSQTPNNSIQQLKISDISFTSNAPSGTSAQHAAPLVLISCRNSQFKRLSFTSSVCGPWTSGAPVVQYIHTPEINSGTFTNGNQNLFEQINFALPPDVGCEAMLHGYAGTGNIFEDMWIKTFVNFSTGPSSGTGRGIVFGSCSEQKYIGLKFIGSGATNCTCLVFNYTLTGTGLGWPQDNLIIGYDLQYGDGMTPVSNTGFVSSGSNGEHPNRAIMPVLENGIVPASAGVPNFIAYFSEPKSAQITTPAVPSAGGTATNANSFAVTVYCKSQGVTALGGVALGATFSTVRVPAGQTVTVSSPAPSGWYWAYSDLA